MKIAIIGAGNIGGNLTRRLTALGHEVAVANSRGPETLADLATETGATAAAGRAGRPDAEVVVVTIPQKNVPGLPAGRPGRAADGAVVVDTGNYYPQQRDGRIAEIEDGLTESEWVAKQLGVPWSRPSTTSTPTTCSRPAGPPATRTARPCRWPATTPRPRTS